MRSGAVLLVLAAACAGLAGCSRLQEAAMPVAEKVNAAYPPAAELRLAQERLVGLLGASPQAVEALNAQVAQRLTLRALTCARDHAVGRFDSVAAVRALQLPRPCLQAQDGALMQLLGLRTIGQLMAQPPLRPLTPAGEPGVLQRGSLAGLASAALARDAGVGVLRDVRGEGLVVQVPGGETIARLPVPTGGPDMGPRLTPNGRVVAVPVNGHGTAFHDAGTGQLLWDSAGSGAGRLLAFLPEAEAFVITGPEGDVLLADTREATLKPHPLAIRHAHHGAQVPGPDARLVMGTTRELVLAAHRRTPAGLEATTLRRFTLQPDGGVTAGQVVPMHDGRRAVFASLLNIGWIDLEQGTSGVWRSAPFAIAPFAKLDERRVMIDRPNLPGGTPSPWSLDVVDGTLAPVDLPERHRGRLVDIADRVGFLRQDRDLWFGDKAGAGDAKPLDMLIAEQHLQQQLRRLEAQTAGAVAAAPLPPMPGLGAVPADALVHMVGVYEGRAAPGAPRTREPRAVRVTVQPSARPIVLVLASHEPVNWLVQGQGGRVAAVLLSGHHPSNVTGVGSVPVLRIGRSHAYSPSSPEYVQLRRTVTQYTGAREIRSFQGAYAGAEFTVGGP